MIGQQISHYQIEREIGRGGMGVVYLATDVRLDRQVALKFLPLHLTSDPSSRERFVAEAKAASALNHHAICGIHDIGKSADGREFMVMPFYEGLTLQQRMEEGPVEPDEAREIARKIAEGLAVAHAAGIVHRDIKAANIMLSAEGRVTILDFGVAKFGAGVDLTRDGSTVGTAAYMSPEQARGEEATAASDLWALGVLLYELLAGKRPFGGSYEAAIAYGILNDEAPPLDASVPQALQEVVGDLMKKDPAARPESASVVALRLAPPGRGSSASVAEDGADHDHDHDFAIPTLLKVVILIAIAGAAILIGLSLRNGGGTVETVALDAIVVFPFDVQAGEDLAYLKRGMVSMLSPMIDGLGGIRSVDSRKVIGLMEQRGDGFLDPEEARVIASELGAIRYILGSVARVGGGLQLSGALYNPAGELVAEKSVAMAGEEEINEAVNEMLASFLPDLVHLAGAQLGDEVVGSTRSFGAMKAYLLAEAAMRENRLGGAVFHARRALQEDSTFAAAWYVAAKSRAMGFSDSVDFHFRGAQRHAATAPVRLRDLIQARLLPPAEALTAHRSLLVRYPDDVDALGYVADQTYHRNPLFGLPDTEAIPQFLELLKYDPDNREYLQHLGQMLLRDEHYDTLDSVLTTAQANGSEAALEDYLPPGPERDAMIEREAQALRFRAMFNAVRGAYRIQDWVRGENKLMAMGADALPPGLLFALRQMDPIRGDGARFEAALKAMDFPEVPNVMLRVIQASLPYVVVSPDSARTLYDSLVVVAQGPEPLNGDWSEAMQAVFVDFMLHHLALRLGNYELAIQHEERLNALASITQVIANLAAEAEARRLLQQGDPAAALDAFEPYRPIEDNELTIEPENNGYRARLLRAKILLALDRNEEALRWAQSVHGGLQEFNPELLPDVYRVQAEAYENLGQWSRAADRYQRFVDLWAVADDAHRPQVVEAQRRLDLVLGRMAEEG